MPQFNRVMAFLLAVAACGGSPAATTVTTVAPQTTTSTQPVFVPAACGDTTPTSVVPTTIVPPEPVVLSTEEQLTVLDGLHNAVLDHYLYPDFNGLDWSGAIADTATDVEAGMSTLDFYVRLEALINSLGDEHSDFEDPAEVAAAEIELQGANEFVGIGVLVDPDIERGHLAVLSVYPDSAADHAGLRPHDRITAVDGVPITVESAPFAHGLRGPECSLVTLTVTTPTESPRQVSAVRAPVTGGIPIEARMVPGEARIGYLMIPTLFDQTIPDQVREALLEFGELDGLILDLRVNGGGSESVLKEILGMFLDGTVGEFESRGGSRTLTVEGEAVANSQTVPLVVLIDEPTESYAEVFAGVLSSEGRATVIGETTLGNVETLRAFQFEDGSTAWLAAERLVPTQNPDADWETTGIVVDIEVVSDWTEFTFATDPAIPAAVDALLGG